MMKIIQKNKFTLAVFGVLLFASCSDDFLDKVNPNAQSTETFWRNNADLNSGLTTVYHALANDNLLAMTNESHRSDLSYPGFNRLQSTNAFYNLTYNNGDGGISNKWDALYTMVFRANQVITNGERLLATYSDEESIEEATNIIAQARFLRGWAYYTLYWMFNEGSVVLFDFVPETEEDFFQPLSDAATIRSFFLTDLEYARENLPTSWNDIDLGRVTVGTATAVLGKHYLYEGDYTTAGELFQDVIENPDYNYSLTASIEDNFSEAGEYNSESIFEIGYSVVEKSEFTGFDFRNVSNRYNKAVAAASSGGFRSILPSAWLAILYRNEAMDLTDSRNYVDSLDTDGNVAGQVLRDFSLRTSFSIALPDDLDTPYYGGLTSPQAAQFNNLEYAYWRKYGNWRTVRREDDFTPDFKSPLNIRLIRLADVFLMYAECLIAGGTNDGGVEEALVYINRVRRRSGVVLLGLNGTGEFPGNDHDNIGYTASSLMEHLMYVERPLELAIEGQAVRFLDLRRWGVFEERFQDLSSREYYTTSVDFINEDGGTSTKFNAVLWTLEDAPDDPINPDNQGFGIKDNLRASENYTPSLHDYYPIPNSEITSNPRIN